MKSLGQDLRYALRQLRNSPGFSLVAIATLALGIGANTAIASAVYDVLLRSLPFTHADRLVLIRETHPKAGTISASYHDVLDWRAQAKSFETLAAYSDVHHDDSQVVTGNQAYPLRAAYATSDLFPTLGLRPQMGRNFLPAEDSDSGLHTAMLSHRVWATRFASDPSVIGQAIQINGQSFNIIGVMPAGQQYPAETDLWLPFAQLNEGERTNRQYHVADAIGRLRDGVTVEQASVELNTIANRLAQSYPATNRSVGIKVTPLRDALVGQLRPTLLALFAAVGLVLFIACANIANLLLIRAANRQREIAVRTALGATRGRLLRQFLSESLVLSSIGAGAGILLAAAAMPLAELRLGPHSGRTLRRLPADHAHHAGAALHGASGNRDGGALQLLPCAECLARAEREPARQPARHRLGPQQATQCTCRRRAGACHRRAVQRGAAVAQLPEAAGGRSRLPHRSPARAQG